MRYQILMAAALVAGPVCATGHAQGAGQSLPVRNGRPAVAAVNADMIWLDELIEAGASTDPARLKQGYATPKDLELLTRLVNVKLVVQEADKMGFTELPEIQKQVDVTSRTILRDVLMEQTVKNVKPDTAAIEKAYKDLVREWKTSSLLFREESAAAKARKEITGGASFSDVATKAVAAKAAKPDTDNDYHPKKAYLPQIADALGKLQVGQVSPVIRLPSGFAVVKVVDVRYPENPEARAEARKAVLSKQHQAVLKAHDEALRRQFVVTNAATLKAVDYEAPKPGLDRLLQDTRVLATIKGSDPVTVGDLTDYLRMQLFHGTDQAGQLKRMNAQKAAALDAMVSRRLMNAEAKRLGLDKMNAYRDRVNGYQDSLVFDAFIQKVIAPENKMREQEVKAYYDAHLKDYSYPSMLKLRGLAFTRRAAAEDALVKLRKGTDFGWLAANAEGQVPKGTDGLLAFDGRPVTVDSMAPALQNAVAGVKAREYRLYVSPEGHYYALGVQEIIAPSTRPFAEVKDEIAKKLYSEKLEKSLNEYLGKLRSQSKVETYLKRMS